MVALAATGKKTAVGLQDGCSVNDVDYNNFFQDLAFERSVLYGKFDRSNDLVSIAEPIYIER